MIVNVCAFSSWSLSLLSFSIQLESHKSIFVHDLLVAVGTRCCLILFDEAVQQVIQVLVQKILGLNNFCMFAWLDAPSHDLVWNAWNQERIQTY